MSAATGAGLDLLREALGALLAESLVHERVRLPPAAGRLRARLYESGHVLAEQVAPDGGWLLEFEMPLPAFERLRRDEALDGYLLREAPLAHMA